MHKPGRLPLHMPWHAMACVLAGHGICRGMPWHMPGHDPAYVAAYAMVCHGVRMACHGLCLGIGFSFQSLHWLSIGAESMGRSKKGCCVVASLRSEGRAPGSCDGCGGFW